MKLTRYSATYKNDFGDIYQADIDELEDGDLAFYEDAAALEAENAALREKLAAAEARTVPAQAGMLTDEPTMLWDAEDSEDGVFAESGADFARAYADNLTPGDDVEVEVQTAVRARLMSMRIVMKPKGYEGDDWFTWEWIDGPAILAASTSPAAQEDAARLDFVIDQQAFIMTIPKGKSGSVAGYQLMVQDEDEDYHELSGDGVMYRTKREAIDAAMSTAKTQ